MRSDVTLQISLAFGDWRYAQHLLPHQLRQLGGQVGEVLLVVDEHRSRGRFARNWEEGREKLAPILDAACRDLPHARRLSVDYAPEAKREVERLFFGGAEIPYKDYRGGPFYSYFYALSKARHNLVFHTDSDLFFGGGSQRWMAEAADVLARHPDVITTSPLPGPPSDESRMVAPFTGRWPGVERAYTFDVFTTRRFLVDRARFVEALCPLPVSRPGVVGVLKALREGNPTYELPERIISRRMRERELRRVDLLGSGMWTLHPTQRCEAFFRRLPDLIRMVESGDVPEVQRGRYNLEESLVGCEEETG